MKNAPKNHSIILKKRDLKLPFTVIVQSEDQTFQVTATKLFKIAPKKRIVCAGKWEDKKIVMKFFLENRRADHYFNKELDGLKALKTSSIRTPEIIFQGIIENSKIKVIATKELFPASDMMSVWNNAKEDLIYADLQKQVLHEVANLHNAGLKQDDLHLGNFLISEDKIYTIDGDGVDIKRMGQTLPVKQSLENLSILFAQFYPHLDKITQKSFEYYAECRNWAPDTISELFIRLKLKTQKVRASKLKKYLKKIFRECSEFVHKKNWKMEMICDRKAYDSNLKNFINNPGVFIEQGKILKNKKSSTIIQIDINNNLYIIKHYKVKSLQPFSEKLLKKTRARISWRNAHLLKQLGKRLPHPLLFLEERFGPFCLNAYLIVEYTPELEINNYTTFFRKLENNKLNPEQGGKQLIWKK